MGSNPLHGPSVARKPLPGVRKPNLHSDRVQDWNPCAWRPLGPQSMHGSIVPRRPLLRIVGKCGCQMYERICV
ncbi:hypothetical protein E2C01_036885 [Portunus trituberculatus]|uniref:Uncharacterized protein n=1 Tax=Portunus trituberculatus TaxID=210409 RepID=A0A5B7FFK2_PORTR|nr:hypothetical protein [Portunus trituberculatus]